jgi:hypothetical protein
MKKRAQEKDLKFLLLVFLATLLMSPLAFGADSSNWHYCQIEDASVGKIKFRGATLDEAMARTAGACVDRQKSRYEKERGVIPSDRAEVFIESCVNRIQCSHG